MTRIAPRSLAKLVFVIYFGDAHGTAITPIDLGAAAGPALPLSLDRRGCVEHRHLDAKRWRRWLMTSLAPSPTLVALVQAATTLPVFLIGLPAGAIADVVDRSPPAACDPGLDALCRPDFGCVDPPERDYAVEAAASDVRPWIGRSDERASVAGDHSRAGARRRLETRGNAERYRI